MVAPSGTTVIKVLSSWLNWKFPGAQGTQRRVSRAQPEARNHRIRNLCDDNETHFFNRFIYLSPKCSPLAASSEQVVAGFAGDFLGEPTRRAGRAATEQAH